MPVGRDVQEATQRAGLAAIPALVLAPRLEGWSSIHLVALVGQVERLAASCGVPFAAFAPLIQASLDNAFRLGPAHALTGPVERGDLATVESHLRALDPAERDSYRALAREAARLTGRRDSALDRLLGDLRQTGRPGSG